MRKILLCCFLISFFFSGQNFAQKKKLDIQESAKKPNLGLLKGQVWLGSPSEYAPKVTILILGNGIKKEIVSGNGVYSVNLPEGLYSLSTAETFDNYSFKRAKFRIKANQTTYLSIDPPLRISAILTYLDKEGFRDKYVTEPKPHYFRLKLPNNNSELDLQIRYFEKKNNGKITEYKKALVTYDTLSIYSDKITLDKKNKIVAEGKNVVLEDGEKRERVSKVSLEIKNGNPIMQITKGAIIGIKGNAQLEKGLATLQFNASRDELDKTSPNFANTLLFQDEKNNIKFVSNYYTVVFEEDNEIILDGTGCVETNKTVGKCYPVGFVAKIKWFEEINLDSEFSINFNSVNSYSFKSKLESRSIDILRN